MIDALQISPVSSQEKVSRLTELLLMGHTWKSVRHIMMLSKPEFDYLLEAAIDRAKHDQQSWPASV
jgi:hypothetical protein